MVLNPELATTDFTIMAVWPTPRLPGSGMDGFNGKTMAPWKFDVSDLATKLIGHGCRAYFPGGRR